MLELLKNDDILSLKATNTWLHEQDKVIIYQKGEYVFCFNFHPEKSFDGYFVPVKIKGEYKVVLSTDSGVFGGHDRADTSYVYKTYTNPQNLEGFNCYLPSRTAIVFKV